MVLKAAIPLAVAFSTVLAAAATINKRIYLGEEAKEGEFPFIVRLHYEDPTLLCGGSLLDSTTVLTAGHCQPKRVTSVRAGSLNKDSGGVVAEVESVVVHPDYKRFIGEVNNDIAILKLSTPIQESEIISYAKLPASGSSPVIGSIAVAAGWGTTGPLSKGDVSDKLLKVAMPIVDINSDSCKASSAVQLPDTKVCAVGGGDTGKGDSGGPLIDQETGQLIGIVSIGPRYTRISSYIRFIDDVNNGINGVDPRHVTG
ncbi:Peptidase cysteine/serine, trypsin-like protein, partial [Metarhizium brunneum ARSEF 3297]